MVISLERGANDLHMVQMMPLPPRPLLLQQTPEWFILLVLGCPGKKDIKRWCACVCYRSRSWLQPKSKAVFLVQEISLSATSM